MENHKWCTCSRVQEFHPLLRPDSSPPRWKKSDKEKQCTFMQKIIMKNKHKRIGSGWNKPNYSWWTTISEIQSDTVQRANIGKSENWSDISQERWELKTRGTSPVESKHQIKSKGSLIIFKHNGAQMFNFTNKNLIIPIPISTGQLYNIVQHVYKHIITKAQTNNKKRKMRQDGEQAWNQVSYEEWAFPATPESPAIFTKKKSMMLRKH